MRILGSVGLVLILAGWSVAQDTNFPAGPQYLITSGSSPVFLQPIATPSLSFDSGLTQSSQTARVETPKADEATYEAVSLILDEQQQLALPSIYYSLPRASAVQVAFPEAVVGGPGFSISSSLFDAGVGEFTSTQALRERGQGVSLGEFAWRLKSQKPSGRHVYTNEDLERLRHAD